MMVVVDGQVFVEQFPGESDAVLNAVIRSALERIYSVMPDWLEYDLGETVWFQGHSFREFKCVAGSVALALTRHATNPDGLGRRLLYLGQKGGDTELFVHGPVGEQVFDESAVQRIPPTTH